MALMLMSVLSGLASCEDARRVDLKIESNPAGQESLQSSQGSPANRETEDQQYNEPTNRPGDTSRCAGESTWSRLSPRRLRPLTRSEIQQTWIQLLTSETTSNESSLPCPAYVFEVDRNQLGEFQAAQTLHIASELNNWAGTIDAGGWPLSPSDDGLYWRLERSLPVGRHLYKIVIDEQHWLTDPNSIERQNDGYGGENSVAIVDCEPSMEREGFSDSDTLSIIKSALRAFPATPRPSHYPFSGHVRSFQISPEHVNTLLDASQVLISLLPKVLSEQLACVREYSRFNQANLDLDGRLAGIDRECINEIIEFVGLRLHRKLLSESTRSRILDLALSESPSVALQVIALSPEALYRSELGVLQTFTPDERSSFGVPDGESAYALSSEELASALSFALWGGPPDNELAILGQQGALNELEILRTQAERLLNHPRAFEHWGKIAVEWLGVEEALRTPKRADLFPQLTDRVRESMISEVSALVATAFLTDHPTYNLVGFRGFEALFGASSPEVEHEELRWLNDELIAYYQLDPLNFRPAFGEGSEQLPFMNGSTQMNALSPYWVKTSERGTHTGRGGILGAGATLLTYAHSDQTSPILRGLFVRERLLCQAFGPPPPNAGGVPEVDPNATTRERFRQHSDDPSCSGCHRLIDEIGFGFEGFDAAGNTREQEAGMLIDTQGVLAGLSSLADLEETLFVGLNELAELLAQSDQARSCLLTQLRRTTFGAMSIFNGVESTSAIGEGEACHLKELRMRLLADEVSLREAIIELILSPEFRLRRGLEEGR